MIGMKLKQARENAALSQRELSKVSGVGYGTISRLENGKQKANFPTRRALSKALDVKPFDIEW
jgi:transcriptional regulator with XRE-family HTH domain